MTFGLISDFNRLSSLDGSVLIGGEIISEELVVVRKRLSVEEHVDLLPVAGLAAGEAEAKEPLEDGQDDVGRHDQEALGQPWQVSSRMGRQTQREGLGRLRRRSRSGGSPLHRHRRARRRHLQKRASRR